MKKLKLILFICCTLLFSANYSTAQNHPHHSKHVNAKKHNRKVVKRSKFRPNKAVIYHPNWAPHRNIKNRWVYFPKHHLYWDNWRNLFFYKHNNKWISNSNLPPHLKSIKLDNEEFQELDSDDEDNDDIYMSNE